MPTAIDTKIHCVSDTRRSPVRDGGGELAVLAEEAALCVM
jgi:hypothetical protein